MPQKNQTSAQSALEYLMTYGWASIIIATIIGVLVFVVGSPASAITFSSSDPIKMLLKAGYVSGSDAVIVLQNTTGGKIRITGIAEEGYSGCTIDGALPPFDVTAGSQMTLECTASADGQGAITLQYTDFAGLDRSVDITARGATGSKIPNLCGNGSLDSGELCDGVLGLSDPDNMECNATCNKIRLTGCTYIEEPGYYFFDSAIGSLEPYEGYGSCIQLINEGEESGDITLEGIGPNAYIDLADTEYIFGLIIASGESLTIKNVRVEGTGFFQIGIIDFGDGGNTISLLNNDTTGVTCGVLISREVTLSSGNQCGSCMWSEEDPGSLANCEVICADAFTQCSMG